MVEVLSPHSADVKRTYTLIESTKVDNPEATYIHIRLLFSQPWHTRPEPDIIISPSLHQKLKYLREEIKQHLPLNETLQIVIAETYLPSTPMFAITSTSKLYKLVSTSDPHLDVS